MKIKELLQYQQLPPQRRFLYKFLICLVRLPEKNIIFLKLILFRVYAWSLKLIENFLYLKNEYSGIEKKSFKT